jgi:hypothetical protein
MRIAIATLGALALATPAGAVESPPSGIAPNVFATQYQGCLGPARSQIAQGNLAGLGPFEEHFTGDVNPGAHQGTVGPLEPRYGARLTREGIQFAHATRRAAATAPPRYPTRSCWPFVQAALVK